MLRIRPYKAADAEQIVTWFQTEEVFRRWGGEHLGTYPIDADAMNDFYLARNGNCEEDNFYPMTAFDEQGICGHFVLRYIHGDRGDLRLGWVILSPEYRGRGYGKEMLSLGIRYAREIYRAEKLSIGVFQDNHSAHFCYLSLGFRDVGTSGHIIEMELQAEE